MLSVHHLHHPYCLFFDVADLSIFILKTGFAGHVHASNTSCTSSKQDSRCAPSLAACIAAASSINFTFIPVDLSDLIGLSTPASEKDCFQCCIICGTSSCLRTDFRDSQLLPRYWRIYSTSPSIVGASFCFTLLFNAARVFGGVVNIMYM
eukprot:SAG31_NODE_6522_length_1988_cov_8.834833_1_plen_150_part_00